VKFSFPWFGLDPRRPCATPARAAYSDSCKLIDKGLKLLGSCDPYVLDSVAMLLRQLDEQRLERIAALILVELGPVNAAVQVVD
jgi:hypothetical protein